MTDRPRDYDGERPTVDLAPELDNSQQVDAGQTQDVAAEAMNLATTDLRLHDTEKAAGGFDDADAQDLVDHMKQMVTSGRIDLSAFEGEPNHDGDDDIAIKEVNGGWGTDPDQDGEGDVENLLSPEDDGADDSEG